MPEHARNRILDSALSLGRTLAPVLFGREARKKARARPIIAPGVSDIIAKTELVVNQIQKSMAEQAIEMLRALAQLTDEVTDLAGTLPVGDKTKALNQIQELLDLPMFAYTEAWVQTLKIVIAGNKATIAAAKKRSK